MLLSQKKQKISGPEAVANILQAMLDNEHEIDQQKEHFWVIGLNGANVIQYVDLVSLGLLNRTLVHPREVFRMAIAKGVNSIIVAHNHPSGSLEPSNDDLAVTKQLKAAGQVVGIEVLDHIILGEGHISLKAANLL